MPHFAHEMVFAHEMHSMLVCDLLVVLAGKTHNLSLSQAALQICMR